MESHVNIQTSNPGHKDEKILLCLLPFWTPMIPPMGISCLKGFIQRHGYRVKTVDANVEVTFKNIYDNYFLYLQECIPANKMGNFYNIGHDLLMSHMTAHLHYTDEGEYIELVRTLMAKNYFIAVDTHVIRRLNRVISEFYAAFEKYFLEMLAKEEPAVLGVSVYRGTLPASLFALKLTREKYPHIKTVMGGGVFSQELDVNSGNLAYFLEKTPYIDKIIIGEGEYLFLKYLRGELPPSQKVYTSADIDNRVLDISTAGMHDASDFDIPKYPSLAAYTSRSCPFQCTFCAETTYWGKYRKKSPAQVVAEFRELFEKYNRQLFLMCDSLLNPIITDLAHECIEKGVSFYWDGYLRVDNNACDEEKTLLWRRGGFYRARLGLETGSPNVLAAMGKKITPARIKQTLSTLAEAGIKTTTYWVIGHPGETEADFRQTLDLIEEMKDDIYEAECNPFRYFESGQINSAQWMEKNKRILLFPENARHLLIIQTWMLDCKPSREEIYRRINRFTEHCEKFGIPNPYSLNDIYKADERWKKLHKNAVPPLLELEAENAGIDENKYVKKIRYGQNKFQVNGDFDF